MTTAIEYDANAEWSVLDEDLVRDMGAGDAQAFATLFDRWHPLVHATVLCAVVDQDAVNDIMERAFWHAWEHASAYDARQGSVEAWLTTITKRGVLRHMQRSHVS